MDSNKKSDSPIDLIWELFISWLMLTVCSIVIGKFISIPLGNILLVTCAAYTLFLILFFIYGLFIATFSKIDEEKSNNRSVKKNEEERDVSANGYIIYSTIAYIVIWILMFIIFPESTDVGEFIRQLRQ